MPGDTHNSEILHSGADKPATGDARRIGGRKGRATGSMMASTSTPAGCTSSEPMTLINEKAASSLEHLVNRLHGESMEGGLCGAKCTARPLVTVVETGR